jgi:high affinity Mn2+ porin
MKNWKMLMTIVMLAGGSRAQSDAEAERWNLYYGATSIGQYHGTFRSPYSGPNSLQGHPERDVSLTTTIFFRLRLDQNTQLYFDRRSPADVDSAA